MTVILGKVLIGIVCAVAAVFAVRSERLNTLPFGSFVRLACVMSLFTRLAIFVLFYFLLGFDVPSDVPAAYYPEAKAALAGKLIYRDFFSTYGALFPYVAAIPVKLWDSTKSIVLFAILLESLGVSLWLRVVASEFPERAVRIAAVLYVFSPLLISTVAIAGQNNVWISPFFAAVVYLLQKRRHQWAGILWGVCLISTKFLALIFLPLLYLCARQRIRFLAGFTVVVGGISAILYSKGADVLVPFRFQRGAGQESSGNLPYLFTLLGIPITSSGYVVLALFLVSCICLLLWISRARLTTRVLVASGTVLFFVIVLLFSKKAFTTYWACSFFPLCIFWSHRFSERIAPVLGFVVWGVTATVEPSLYFRWVSGTNVGIASLPLFRSVIFLACQAVLLGFNLLLLGCSLGDVRRSVAAGRPTRPDRAQPRESVTEA